MPALIAESVYRKLSPGFFLLILPMELALLAMA
jgi:hypothetical protein